jgi:hypothetical protein
MRTEPYTEFERARLKRVGERIMSVALELRRSQPVPPGRDQPEGPPEDE